jgi:flagellar basal-body rod modification protein FlgD
VEINEIQATQTPAPESQTVADQAGLGQDAFLKIFLTQLEHQDPLDPQDSSELAAQLAQFSQLEQSLRMTNELRGISSRLDQLIEASSSNGNLALDPMAMLGRQVDIDGNFLRLPGVGTSQSLLIDLEGEATQLLIELQDASGAPLGLAELIGEDDNGNPVILQQGTYELSFVDNEPRVRTPSGQEIPLTFFALTENEEGRLVPDENRAVVIPPPAGMTYQFSVMASSRSGGPFEPHTMTAGTVDGVRIVSGQPIPSIAGQDIDISQIIRIR